MLLPARLQGLHPLGVSRPVAANVDRRRRALEHVQMLRVPAQVRHALHGSRAGADNGDALVGELVQISVGIAARVAVVPAAGVESMAFVALDAGNAGQLRPVQRPVGHDDEARAHAVAAVGRDDPAAFVLAPGDRLDRRLKARVAIEIELLTDAPRVREDFRRERVLLLRDVAGLLEQRQINVRLDIALRAGIAVPVPGAAEVPAFLDDADVLHTRLAQTRARQQAAEAAADDHHVNRVGQRRPSEAWIDVRVIHIAAEVALHFDVLLVGVGADALVALLLIPGAEGFGVEVEPVLVIAGGRNVFDIAHGTKLLLEPYSTRPKHSSTTAMTKRRLPFGRQPRYRC